jgi:hypothetical protein
MVTIGRLDAAKEPVVLIPSRGAAWDQRARISRVKTLDGGSTVSHYGTTDLDRDLTFDCRLSDDQAVQVRAILRDGERVRITTRDGVYLGYIQRAAIQPDNRARITFFFDEVLK